VKVSGRLPCRTINNRHYEIVSTILGLAVIGMIAAPVTILARGPDLTTRTGRHLVAGALGMIALVVLEVVICLIPLQRGEGWALWAAMIPLLILGIPIFLIDATFVPARARLATLLPQAIGDGVALALLGYLFWLRARTQRVT
jgi:hypothetical protein